MFLLPLLIWFVNLQLFLPFLNERSCQHIHLLIDLMRMHRCCNLTQTNTDEFDMIWLTFACMYFKVWISPMWQVIHTNLCDLKKSVCIHRWEVKWYSRGQQETIYNNNCLYHLLAMICLWGYLVFSQYGSLHWHTSHIFFIEF